MACGAMCPPSKPMVVEIAAGDSHSCARLVSGAVSCWGANAYGQLGNGNRLGQPSPSAVRGIADAAELALGRARSCVRHRSGAVSCWGAKADPGGWIAEPTVVPGLTDAVALAAGSGQVCAIRAGGSAVCWGDGSQHGTSGIAGSDTPEEFFPALPPDLPPVFDISASSDSVCLVAQGVACFVRDGSVVNPVQGYSTVQIAGGVADHHCGRTRTNSGADGSGVACWGENGYGQLGFAKPWDGVSAVDWVQGLPNAQIESIAVGGSSSCALFAAGTAYCWGDNSSGQLGGGPGPSRLTPTLVAGLTSSTQIALGESHACALLADGGVSCWGSNSSGQLGDGTTQDRTAPTVVRF
jgi:Regulator of chromosome condensation (RCC1) repeat